ncbi:UNVERIFIED_CONTAM: hypothetical protein GTU68_052629 [Idotea baltica]|nr:hypothetical protein [Idotea baltica]
MKRITKGLNLPIEGEPDQTVGDTPPIKTIATIGPDYVGMKPTMQVEVGDTVKLGQTLFTDKKNPGVNFTANGSGTVTAVNRGAKRAFESLTIELSGDEEVEFASFKDADLTTLTRDQVRDALTECGLWTSFRTRPFSRIPSPESSPASIFVQAIDTNPLAADPVGIIRESEAFFSYGLNVIRHLTDGKIYLCGPAGTNVPGNELDFVQSEGFEGPHPAGLPGTHIHFLDPVGPEKTVWYLNYQDVIAIGKFMVSGRLSVDRVVAIGGPVVKRPRLIRTRLGASIDDIMANELIDGENRVISGSVLSGRKSEGTFGYLGRYHLQISAIAEGREREFMGWQKPGFDKFSIKKVFASSWLGGGKRFSFNTSTSGSPRAMVPIGMFEDVMPMDIIPTYLLRSLLVGDTEQAQALGALELDEEDLALCTFVCPGKTEYGPILRTNLTQIEKEG